MKKMILLIFTMILFAVSVNASLVSVKHFNWTDLPVTGIESFNFSLVENETIMATLIQSDGHSNFTFPLNVTVKNGTNMTSWYVNYSLPSFFNYSGNSTRFDNLFGITNTYNPNLLLLELNFVVHHPPLIEEPEEPPEAWMDVNEDGNHVEVKTYSVIDFNRTHTVTIAGLNGSLVNITCTGKFIHCPSNVAIGANNMTTVDIEIMVPAYTETGVYESKATFSQGNKSGSVTFSIDVEFRDDIYKVIQYDVWKPECYDSPENLAECYKAQSRYNAEVASSLLKKIDSCDVKCECNETVIVNETIKYVEVGNIDRTLFDNFDELRGEYMQCSRDYSDVSRRLKDCIDENYDMKNDFSNERNVLGNTILLKEKEYIEEYEQKSNDAEDRGKVIVMKFLWTMFWFSLAFLVIGKYFESVWWIKHFPTKLAIIFILMTAIIIAIFKFFIGW